MRCSRLCARFARDRQVEVLNGGLLAIAIVALLLYVVLDSTPVPESDRGMYPVLQTGESYFLDQQDAVELADDQAEPGTAILVLGSMLSWHDQFWSFQWSDRPFFFNDWLWYWQKDHFGQYDPDPQHAYPDLASTLSPEYLQTHGIGAGRRWRARPRAAHGVTIAEADLAGSRLTAPIW